MVVVIVVPGGALNTTALGGLPRLPTGPYVASCGDGVHSALITPLSQGLWAIAIYPAPKPVAVLYRARYTAKAVLKLSSQLNTTNLAEAVEEAINRFAAKQSRVLVKSGAIMINTSIDNVTQCTTEVRVPPGSTGIVAMEVTCSSPPLEDEASARHALDAARGFVQSIVEELGRVLGAQPIGVPGMGRVEPFTLMETPVVSLEELRTGVATCLEKLLLRAPAITVSGPGVVELIGGRAVHHPFGSPGYEEFLSRHPEMLRLIDLLRPMLGGAPRVRVLGELATVSGVAKPMPVATPTPVTHTTTLRATPLTTKAVPRVGVATQTRVKSVVIEVTRTVTTTATVVEKKAVIPQVSRPVEELGARGAIYTAAETRLRTAGASTGPSAVEGLRRLPPGLDVAVAIGISALLAIASYLLVTRILVRYPS